MESNQNEAIEISTTFRDYMRVIFRHLGVILTCLVTVTVTVYVGLKMKTPVYEASVKMLISAEKQVEAPYYRDLVGYQNVERSLTQSEIVKADPVIERAVRALRLETRPIDYERMYADPLKHRLISYQAKTFRGRFERLTGPQKEVYLFRMAVKDLKDSIKVEPVRDTNLFTITARDFDPVGAAVIANVVSRSYVIFDLEQQLAELTIKYGNKHTAVTQLQDKIAVLTANLNGMPLDAVEAIGPASVKVIEQANIPLKPSGTSKVLTMALALFMSLFLGVMMAFVFEYMDQTFKSPQDIEQFLKVPFLGSIPHKQLIEQTLIKNIKGRSPYVKLFQSLSDQVYLLARDKKLRAVLVTSVEAGEGTANVVANVGQFLSEAGHQVLLIDADLRRPELHKILKIKASPGLADILEDKAYLSDLTVKVNAKLSVLPAGQTELNPVIILDSALMRATLDQARNKFELVLVNCPGLKSFKDALVLASEVDATAVVVNEGTTRRQVAKAALAPLQQRGVKVLGAVLNNRTFPIPKFFYERI